MTYQNMKNKLITEDSQITSKVLNKFIIRMILTILGFVCLIGLGVFKVLGTMPGFAVIILLLLGFSQIFNIVAEDVGSFKKFNLFSRFWILWFILTIVEYLVLSYFRFI